jgi:hypothetical protein
LKIKKEIYKTKVALWIEKQKLNIKKLNKYEQCQSSEEQVPDNDC